MAFFSEFAEEILVDRNCRNFTTSVFVFSIDTFLKSMVILIVQFLFSVRKGRKVYYPQKKCMENLIVTSYLELHKMQILLQANEASSAQHNSMS